MNTDRHSLTEKRELIEDPDERAAREAENGIYQFELLIQVAREHIGPSGRPFRLKTSTVVQLNEAALRDIDDFAGAFRNRPIKIIGSRHAPPPWPEIADEVTGLCEYVNSNFAEKTA